MRALATLRSHTVTLLVTIGALAAVVAAAGPGAALVITHGAFIAEACRQATASRPFAFINVDNASITRIAVLPGGRQALIGFNDIAHLGE